MPLKISWATTKIFLKIGHSFLFWRSENEVSKHLLAKDHREVAISHSFSLNSGYRISKYQFNNDISFASIEYPGFFCIYAQKKSQLKQKNPMPVALMYHTAK